MRRLILITATTAIAFLLLASPAWADWVWPLRGEVITPYRNGTDPYASGQHRGIDIAGAVGTPVVAAAGGEVRFAGKVGSSGLTVSIRTADGRYDTSYLHLSSTAVRKGDHVATGERVGAVGTTGIRSAAAPHLHFGVRMAGTEHAYLDPIGLLPPAPTAPEAPRGAPAPQPAPVAPAPRAAPVQAPTTRRAPVGSPSPRRVPVGSPAPRRQPGGNHIPRRVPVGSPSPRRVRVGSPSPRRAPVGSPAPHRIPVGSPTPRPHTLDVSGPSRVPGGAPAPHGLPTSSGSEPREPVGAPARARGPVGVSTQRPAPAHGPAAGASPSGQPVDALADGRTPAHGPIVAEPGFGPDTGLVLACLGLLTAAALLGLTDDGQRASRRTGQRIARALRPVLGRR